MGRDIRFVLVLLVLAAVVVFSVVNTCVVRERLSDLRERIDQHRATLVYWQEMTKATEALEEAKRAQEAWKILVEADGPETEREGAEQRAQDALDRAQEILEAVHQRYGDEGPPPLKGD